MKTQNSTNDYESLLVKYNTLKEAVPPPDKLELLAKWFDFKYKDDENPEVQEDLRRWANNLRNALEDK